MPKSFKPSLYSAEGSHLSYCYKVLWYSLSLSQVQWRTQKKSWLGAYHLSGGTSSLNLPNFNESSSDYLQIPREFKIWVGAYAPTHLYLGLPILKYLMPWTILIKYIILFIFRMKFHMPIKAIFLLQYYRFYQWRNNLLKSMNRHSEDLHWIVFTK
jgi:hypothetical protein